MATPPAPPKQKTKWRTKLLIFPKFQVPLIIINSLFTVGGFVFVWAQAYRSYAYLHELGVSAQLPADHVYYEFVALQAKTLYQNLGWATGVTIVASGFATLYLSFRFAGPLVRLHKYFQGIVDAGRITGPLSFRRGDFLSDLPPVVNQALKRVDGQAGSSSNDSPSGSSNDSFPRAA